MANPALSNSPAFKSNGPAEGVDSLQDLYDAPAATTRNTGRMSYEDTAIKTVTLFVVLLATAFVGWQLPGLAIVGGIVGLVLGLVNAFKREPNVPLIVAYAAAQGLFLGGISVIIETYLRVPGAAFQAVLATFVTFGVTLALFANGKVRVSPKMNKIFLIGMVSLLAFSVVNILLSVTGVVDGPFGLRFGVLGLVIGAIAIFLGAYSLVMDFDFIQEGTRKGLAAKYGWTAAFGLIATLVFLYVEFLRLIAILRGD